MDGIFYQESKGMNITTDKNLRTAAAIAVWVTLLALSQETAASEGCACVGSSAVMIGRQ